MSGSPFPPRCASLFQPTRLLATGGFSTVYLAHQLSLDRDVAIKLLQCDLGSDPSLSGRFRNEARITAALSSPHVIVVLDHDVEDGVPWIAYEYLPGRSLRSVIDEGPLAWQHAVAIACQIARALEEAHANGIIHRDIKPENVLEVARGHYKVADFGIARSVLSRVATQEGVLLGTPAYMAPELLTSAATDASDVYSLGVLLFEALTHTLPFRHGNPCELLRLHQDAPVPRPSEICPDLPPELDPVVMRALCKDPTQRFPTARAVRLELERLVPATSASSPTWERPAGRSRVQRPSSPTLHVDSNPGSTRHPNRTSRLTRSLRRSAVGPPAGAARAVLTASPWRWLALTGLVLAAASLIPRNPPPARLARPVAALAVKSSLVPGRLRRVPPEDEVRRLGGRLAANSFEWHKRGPGRVQTRQQFRRMVGASPQELASAGRTLLDADRRQRDEFRRLAEEFARGWPDARCDSVPHLRLGVAIAAYRFMSWESVEFFDRVVPFAEEFCRLRRADAQLARFIAGLRLKVDQPYSAEGRVFLAHYLDLKRELLARLIADADLIEHGDLPELSDVAYVVRQMLWSPDVDAVFRRRSDRFTHELAALSRSREDRLGSYLAAWWHQVAYRNPERTGTAGTLKQDLASIRSHHPRLGEWLARATPASVLR